MSAPTPPVDALDPADLARLDELFELINPGEAMVLEELDGFFTALVCSGDGGPASSYLRDVLGIDEGGAIKYPQPALAIELETLLSRHWQSIRNALTSGETLAPLLAEEDAGMNPGNLWALGFLRGIDAQPDPWEDVGDETLAEWLEPIEALAEEIDFETGEARLKLTEEDRDQLLDEMFDTVFDAYQHFIGSKNLQ